MLTNSIFQGAKNVLGGTPISVPESPTSLAATFNDPNVNLVWVAPVSGDLPTSYKIEYQFDDGAWQTLVANTGNTNVTYQHNSPSAGTWNYRVSGLNAAGEGAPSNEDSAVVSPSTITSVYTTHYITVSGAASIHGYGVSLPSDYASNKNDYPTIIFFHGAGESGTDLNKIDDNGILETVSLRDWYCRKGFVTIAPQTTDTTNDWEGKDDQINAFMNAMMLTYRINPNMIYWTGLSAGSYSVLSMTCGSQYAVIPEIEPAAVCGIAGGYGDTSDQKNLHSAMWFFRRDGDGIAASMAALAALTYAASNPQENLFTNWVGSSHGGWDYVYKTGTDDAAGSESLLGSTVNIGGNDEPNILFPDTGNRASLGDWFLSFHRGGDASPPIVSATEDSVGADYIDIDVNTGEAGTAYVKVYSDGAEAPSKLDIFVGFDVTTVVSVGSNIVKLPNLAGSTSYDIYGFVEDANGNRSEIFKVDATTSAAPTEIRRANLNHSNWGVGAVSDPEWVNSTNNIGLDQLHFDNPDDSTGAPTTWKMRIKTASMGTGTVGGTPADDASIGVPEGTTVRLFWRNANDVTVQLDFEGLDDSKLYKLHVILYSGDGTDYDCHFGTNDPVRVTANNDAHDIPIGSPQPPVSGVLSMVNIPRSGKKFGAVAWRLIEYEPI